MNGTLNTNGSNVPRFDVNGIVITLCQARVISLNIHGLQRKEMADLLGNSQSTINAHFDRIYRLVQLNDRVLLLRWAMANGFDDKGNLNGQYLFDGYKGMPWEDGGERP